MSINTPPGGPLPYPADDQNLWDQLDARPCVAIPVSNTHVTQTLLDGPCILVGFAFRETAAAAGTIDFKDGRDATGEDAGSFVIAASGGLSQSVGVKGVLMEVGLTVIVASSTIRGAVWVKI